MRIQSGARPLHKAACIGYRHEGAIRVLLEGRADIDAQTKVWPHVGGMQGVGGGRAQAPPTPSHRSLSLSLRRRGADCVCLLVHGRWGPNCRLMQDVWFGRAGP